MKQPTLTIIVPTLNNASEITPFLHMIRSQSYPQRKIDILFVDGGSTDGTIEHAKQEGIRIIPNPHVLAEPAVSLGMEHATGDLMMVMATDNLYKDHRAIELIVGVFQDANVYAALPKQDYDETDTFLTRYHNTFTDPFNHFVYGHAANTRTFHKIYKTITHNDTYDVYDFRSHATPPMMSFSQGFTIRGDYRRNTTDFLDDVTPVMNLITSNKHIAYVHAVSVYHHTIRSIAHFIKKQRWATQNALAGKKYGIAHRYNKLSQSQQIKMMLWPVYAPSVIFPFLRSLVGLVQDREPLWLYHPIECFLCAYANGIQLISYNVSTLQQKNTSISRQ